MIIYIIIGVLSVIMGNLLFIYIYRKRISGRLEMSGKVINSIPDIMFLIDDHLIIRKIYNGKKIHEDLILGKHIKEYVDTEFIGNVESGIQHVLKSDDIVKVEYSVTYNGCKLYFEGRFKRLNEKYVICFEQDITERRKKDLSIKQNEKLLNAVLDNMPMPLIIKDIDDELKYVYWNKQCELTGGYTREQILGKTDIEIYGEERGQYYQSVDKKIIEDNGSYRAQEIYVTPDGVKHYSIVNKNVVSNDAHNWLMATRWDITDLIKVQEQLQEANRQMKIAFAVTFTVPLIWDIATDLIYLKFQEFKDRNDNFFKNKNGVSSSDVIRYIHPDDKNDILQIFKDIKEGTIDNAHREIRYDVTGKYETYYDLYLTVDKRDKSGSPLRIIGTLRDITDNKLNEKKLIEANRDVEEAQEINQLILNHTNNGLVFLTPDFKVQWSNVDKYSNHPFALRYKKGCCCYKAVLGQTEPCTSCSAGRAMLSGKIEKGERRLIGGMDIEVTAIPVFDKGKEGNIRGCVLKFEDVTVQRKAADALKEAKEAAEKSDRLKSLFLSNMSHEIRTPLNAIVGFSELLAATEDNEEKQEYMSVISRNNDLLLQLINDILDLSKIEANTLEFVYSEVDINEMLKTLEMTCRRKSVNPEVDIVFIPSLKTCVINTEQNRVLQVISNLVSNAMKFTREGHIRFGYELEEHGLRFFVSDTGRGIPEEQQHDVFKRFVKLDTFTNGTGLGLPICTNIVQRLGGEIGVYTNESGGCTFWFTLPVKPVESTSFQEQEAKTAAIAPMDKKDNVRIKLPVLLIAEDVVDNFRLYQTMLKGKFTLLHAWNGEEAVELFEKNNPDAILMDIKMPVMDGYEAIAKIRSVNVDIPIIAVSACAFSDDIERIMKSGFTGYVTKPINKTALLEALEFLK